MSIGNEDYRRVAVSVSVALCGLDELFNLSFGQVLPAAKLAVRLAQRANCSFLDGWLHQPQVRFCWHFSPRERRTARTKAGLRAVALDNRCVKRPLLGADAGV